MINYQEVVDRIKHLNNFVTNKEVAKLFGISEPDFCRRKKQKTLLPLIVAWGMENDVNMHWLLTGDISEKGVEDLGVEVGENSSGYGTLDNVLLKEVILAIETGFTGKKRSLAPVEKAEAIALLYEFYLGSSKAIDDETVGRYLRLVTTKSK